MLPTSRLPDPYRDEVAVVRELLGALEGQLDWSHVMMDAWPWVMAVREHPAPFWALESLLREYPIASAEGLALMRLAEALLRVPDVETAIAFTADQLSRAAFDAERGGEHSLFASLSARVIALSKTVLPGTDGPPGLLRRLGAQTVVAATVRAVQLLARQFVLGRDIDEALHEAHGRRAQQPHQCFSFDMLGEGARTDRDAQRYMAAYGHAIERIAADSARSTPMHSDGISIKLSALHPRYEAAQWAWVEGEMMPRVLDLARAAAAANLNLTIDAEESERLELSLMVLERLARHTAREFPHWRGLGLAVQAYQTRAREVIDAVAGLARDNATGFMVRLVKGAYWDSEIKRAQELGLSAYPVFSHKHHTDISYLACAARLLRHGDVLYPQFATHNAGTLAALLRMAADRPFELQRLHGMGEGIYREVLKSHPLIRLRTYAPVGGHRDLLAYLVRRLLENGANSSFVHQLSDDDVPVDTLLASPLRLSETTGQHLPVAIYGARRRNARGIDLSCPAQVEPLLVALGDTRPTVAELADPASLAVRMVTLRQAWPRWEATSLTQRVRVLRRTADLLEEHLPRFTALLCLEGRKTLPDAVAEVREAVDFCRYYATQAATTLSVTPLPGPTGEQNTLRLRGRGVFVCISPWNFPLAIFAGQVVAALVAGNTVAAKPAEQTPAVALAFVELLREAGLPADALDLFHGSGETVGAALVADAHCAGVCFTGSTQVARHIQRSLAGKTGPMVPLIAETGGLNAMIVDSTALPEQVVDSVIQSAFRSAGQRCSALRLLCLQQSIAQPILHMLAGAMQQLRVGDPALLATDVGPVIDAAAHATLQAHLQRLHRTASWVASTPMAAEHAGTHVAPVTFEIARIADLTEEIFGPVLHIVRWSGDVDALVGEVNGLGYGLTLGVHTRIDGRAQRIAALARVGNVYVNRNMIGAVVGVQPFGGEGLSGTGPKAGGPHYLTRFCTEQTVTINTAAAGGNVALYTQSPRRTT